VQPSQAALAVAVRAVDVVERALVNSRTSREDPGFVRTAGNQERESVGIDEMESKRMTSCGGSNMILLSGAAAR
jgi:hypothetical protein